MSLANKFLRYFHRVHFGENKKTQFSPLTPSPNQSWLYRHLEQWNNIDWWVVVKGGGGGSGRPFGHFTELSSYCCGM